MVSSYNLTKCISDVPAAVQKQKAAVGLESIFSIRSTKSTLFDISRDLKY